MTGSRICLARFSERRTPIEVTFDAALKGVKSGFEHENRVIHEGHILLKNGWDEAEEETCNASCDDEVDGKLNELWISGYICGSSSGKQGYNLDKRHTDGQPNKDPVDYSCENPHERLHRGHRDPVYRLLITLYSHCVCMTWVHT